MRMPIIKTLAQRQEEIDKAKLKQTKIKSVPPEEKTLDALLLSVRKVVDGFAGKSDVDIFEIAGYGNRDEAQAAYNKAVQSNADDGLVRAYLIGRLKREALSLSRAEPPCNTNPAV